MTPAIWYADFLCPQCGRFQETYGEAIDRHVNAGDLLVRYHMVPMLTGASDPPGYSLDAANASLCAADAGKFASFHHSLFGQQPKEGNRGYGKAQPTALGVELGITDPVFAQCVANGDHDQRLREEFAKTTTTPALKQKSGDTEVFGTPTVVADDKMIDFRREAWLTDLLSAKG